MIFHQKKIIMGKDIGIDLIRMHLMDTGTVLLLVLHEDTIGGHTIRLMITLKKQEKWETWLRMSAELKNLLNLLDLLSTSILATIVRQNSPPLVSTLRVFLIAAFHAHHQAVAESPVCAPPHRVVSQARDGSRRPLDISHSKKLKLRLSRDLDAMVRICEGSMLT